MISTRLRRVLIILLCAAAMLALATPAPASADADLAIALSRRAENLARRAAFHLDQARVERDLRRVRCQDSVLSQTHAVLRMVRYRLERAEEASPARQATVLSVLDRRLDELEADLRTCNGEHLSSAPNATQVIVIVDRSVPREDPTRLHYRRSAFHH